MMNSILEIKSLDKRFGSRVLFQGFDLEVRAGERFFILGPSGCGKTTLLRMIAGLEPVDRGTIFVQGMKVEGPGVHRAPGERDVGFVFQDGALWPHMTVLQHLLFVLEGKMPRSEARRRAAEFLAMVKLEGFEDRHPDELSGGERQRVALARALVTGNSVLLLDEPFSNLDRPLARELIEDVAALHRRLDLTTLLVTHSQEDALLLADRMGVIRAGRLLQTGRPEEIYHSPRDLFVAGFLGDNNFLPARCDGRGTLSTPLGDLPFRGDEGDYVFCVRPAALSPSRDGEGVPGRLLASRFMGDGWRGKVRLDGGAELHVDFGASPPEPGEWFIRLTGPWTALPEEG